MEKPLGWGNRISPVVEKHPANREGFWLYRQPGGLIRLRRMPPGSCPRCGMAETVRTFTSMHEALSYLGRLYPEMADTLDTLKEMDNGND